MALIDGNNEATPEAVAYTINKAIKAAGATWNDITVSYDSVRQGSIRAD